MGAEAVEVNIQTSNAIECHDPLPALNRLLLMS